MEEKPFVFSPRTCFILGVLVPILFSGMYAPPPLEFQTLGNVLFSLVVSIVYSGLMFWFISVRRPGALFPILCAMLGSIFGATGVTLFQGVDVLFTLGRMILSLIASVVLYQYFAKKIKHKKS